MIAIRFNIVFSVAFLAGCSAFSGSPVVQALKTAIPQARGTERTQFDPSFHYLRVVVDGNVIFMASDTHNIDDQGTTAVWYSAAREVLRFQSGRLIAAVGLKEEWRGVSIPELPKWSTLAMANEPLQWTRVRDVMPGYRYDVKDSLVLQKISPPSDSHLKGIDLNSLTWFEERFVPTSDSKESLPLARYAVDLKKGHEWVVYGEQCISKSLCLSWQRWPVTEIHSK